LGVERHGIGGGCSAGNAGHVVRGSVTPLATKASVSRGLRQMFDRSAAFQLRPQLSLSFVGWLSRFLVHAATRDATATMRVMYSLSVASSELHDAIAAASPTDYGYKRTGKLEVFEDPARLKGAIHKLETLRTFGITGEVLTAPEARRLESLLSPALVGAVWYPEDRCLHPQRFVEAMAQMAQASGAEFLSETDVVGFEHDGTKVIAAKTAGGGTLRADSFVIASGAWSAALSKMLGVHFPLAPGRGYSLTLQGHHQVGAQVMLVDADTAVSPMLGATRVTSGMQLVGFGSRNDDRRVTAMLAALDRFFTETLGERTTQEAWYGYRPMTPDDLPILGPVSRFPNLILATGHGSYGITLAPITGKVVSELIGKPSVSLDIAPLAPGRFGV
jgi:D-amino-acid dehydrogenase